MAYEYVFAISPSNNISYADAIKIFGEQKILTNKRDPSYPVFFIEAEPEEIIKFMDILKKDFEAIGAKNTKINFRKTNIANLSAIKHKLPEKDSLYSIFEENCVGIGS